MLGRSRSIGFPPYGEGDGRSCKCGTPLIRRYKERLDQFKKRTHCSECTAKFHRNQGWLGNDDKYWFRELRPWPKDVSFAPFNRDPGDGGRLILPPAERETSMMGCSASYCADYTVIRNRCPGSTPTRADDTRYDVLKNYDD